MNLQSLASAALLLLGAAAPGTFAAEEDYNPAGFMDPAYILPCDRSQGNYPVYCADGCTYGPAWYCNSGEWVGDKYDTCNGEPGCAHLHIYTTPIAFLIVQTSTFVIEILFTLRHRINIYNIATNGWLIKDPIKPSQT